MARVTFTLDDATISRLRATANRLARPQSWVVREGIAEYGVRVDRLSQSERLQVLKAFDELVPAIPRRPAKEVSAEIGEIRRLRRGGGRAAGPRP